MPGHAVLLLVANANANDLSSSEVADVVPSIDSMQYPSVFADEAMLSHATDQSTGKACWTASLKSACEEAQTLLGAFTCTVPGMSVADRHNYIERAMTQALSKSPSHVQAIKLRSRDRDEFDQAKRVYDAAVASVGTATTCTDFTISEAGSSNNGAA